EWNIIFKYFYELHHGIKELLLSLSKQKSFVSNYLDPACQRQYQQAIKAKTLYTIVSRWGDLFLLASLGVVIFTLPTWSSLSFADLKEFLLIFLFTLSPLTTILAFLGEMERIKISLQKIEEVGLLIQADTLFTVPHQLLPNFKTLRLENISYKYYSDVREYPFYLDRITLSFERSQVVFITGGNGSGKSTLVKLLCGLYTPDAGHLYLDETMINERNRQAYRQNFSVVFADAFLFEELLGFEGVELQQQAHNYLKKLELDHKLKIINNRFSTIQLSQGQRQRLALLVACLEDKQIYIFDEWASNQDPHFKKVFYYEIIPELKAQNKLIFMISHDESYYHIADRIIKLEEGRVVENQENKV
ncbi:MAG: ATP-binding cassette domain-containing protein, partial [Jaaginema sp. PMC 1079.18]|nr:ATP-binding cassette domain-containing protein [Jaaginema sp. PMC 1079.18]